jgi:hypothetical protein
MNRTVIVVEVHGKALEGNLEGDSPDRDVAVYLPPGDNMGTHAVSGALSPARFHPAAPRNDIDAHYRTISSVASRGLAGHSMGGYGAMRIGMKHPEVF